MTTPNDQQPNDQQRGDDEPRVVVRDRRRIDPETGELRLPQPAEEVVVNEAGQP
ncbi:MAG: nucleotide exchange factor GrpE, partial [Sciscionella sp.]